jgi:hypothetical protein
MVGDASGACLDIGGMERGLRHGRRLHSSLVHDFFAPHLYNPGLLKK